METMPRREPWTCLIGLDHAGLTDVTAAAKNQPNRARSVVAGVVSGAGVRFAGDSKTAL